MISKSIVSPEDQNATFVELFFDLVFVFSVTQIVSLLHHGLDATNIVHAVLVFWMVWWAWTQFTWALNAADTTHRWVEFGTLIVTGVAFFQAIAVPDAFTDKAIWFVIPYILVRVIGLVLYIWVAWEDQAQRAAVRTFGVLSLGGLVTVFIGAFFTETAQVIIWTLAIVLDVIAAAIGGRAEGWGIHPKHFAERHGLFVIIALGETLIIAASEVTGAELTGDVILVTVLVVAITGGFWWSYFAHTKDELEHALASVSGAVQSTMGRDVYSLLHYPMLCGVIAFAIAVEEIVSHPTVPLELEGRLALAVGLLLFVGGMVIAVWRAKHRWMVSRLSLTVLTAILIVILADVNPVITLMIVLVCVVLIAVIEERNTPEHMPSMIE